MSNIIGNRCNRLLGRLEMAREQAVLACTECKRRNYMGTRNKRTQTNRLELVKFCPYERKRTLHRETR